MVISAANDIKLNDFSRPSPNLSQSLSDRYQTVYRDVRKNDGMSLGGSSTTVANLLKIIQPDEPVSTNSETCNARSMISLDRDIDSHHFSGTAVRLFRRKILLILAYSLPCFGFFALCDYFVLNVIININSSEYILGLRSDQWMAALANIPGVSLSIIGITLTVATFILQLSAQRYSQNVIEIFFKDQPTSTCMQLYVFNCVGSLILQMQCREDFTPSCLLVTVFISMIFSVVSIIPFFRYVFSFISPSSQVLTIQRHALVQYYSKQPCPIRQAKVLNSLCLLQNFGLSSITHRDGTIAHETIVALRKLLLQYLNVKNILVDSSFLKFSKELSTDEDFQNPTTVAEVKCKGTWIEFKILSVMSKIYTEALGKVDSANREIVGSLLSIGIKATDCSDKECLRIVIKFFNTFLRKSCNLYNVKELCRLMNDYRLLVEHLLQFPDMIDEALSIVRFLQYYARIAFNMELRFVSECCAYDLCTILEIAYRLNVDISTQETMMDIFLEIIAVDCDINNILRGVRKAQLKLGAFYLSEDALSFAVRLREGIGNDNRLVVLAEELQTVLDPRYWEVEERGNRFDYLPPLQRQYLLEFCHLSDDTHLSGDEDIKCNSNCATSTASESNINDTLDMI